MTKNDLADLVAERTGISGSQARQVVEATISTRFPTSSPEGERSR